MSSEISKNVKLPGDQEITLQQRDQSGGAEPDGGEDNMSPLVQQSSILSMCEPWCNVESMNMDEFMTNIWIAEEIEAVTGSLMADAEAAVMGSAGSGGGGGGAGEGGLCRQGSFSLPPPVCQRTMDEVWADINQEPAQAQASPRPLVQPQPQLGSGMVEASGQQATLGDMTLDDFLVKAGVVRGLLADDQAPMPVSGVLVPEPMNPIPVQQQPGQPGPMMYPVVPANTMYPVMGDGMGLSGGYHGGMAVVPLPPPSQGPATEVSPGSSNWMSALLQADMINCTGKRAMVEKGAQKRCAPQDWSNYKSVERRRRDMIRNRESAARARARKQAYIVELESELNRLKEENARLKAEEALLQKTILLAKKQMLIEKMIEQSKENVNAKKSGRLCRSWSCMW